MRMGIGLGVGINRSNYAQGIFNAYSARVVADGGVVESGTCVDAVSSLLQSASLLLIPSGYKGGKLYAEIPTNGNGDLTWTRGSDAFRTNASGVLQRVPWNLLQYSEQFDNAYWGKTNSTVTSNTTISPSGNQDADTFTDASASYGDVFAPAITITPNATYTVSVFIKKTTGALTYYPGIGLLLSGSANRQDYSIINTTTGQVVRDSSSNINSVTYSTQSVNDYWRVVITFTDNQLNNTLGFRMYPAISSNGTTISSAAQGSNVFWGAQLVEGTTAQTYFPTTDRLNVPRLSYMYGSCPALLLEPQRTNLFTYSSQLDDVNWSKQNCTITANSSTAPDGTLTADLVDDGTAVITQHWFFQYPTFANNTTYTISFYAKYVSRKYMSVNMFNGVTSQYVDYDIQNGSVFGSTGDVTASIINVGNGWYRVVYTRTTAITGTPNFRIAMADDTANESYTGSNKQVLIWGLQLEQGAYPTTYIPTTSATATRVADSFSRSNIYTNGLISASGGTWFVELRGNVVYTRDGAGSGIFIDTNTNGQTNGFALLAPSGGGRMRIWKVISGSFSTLYTTTTDTTKIAIKWNGTSADVFVNGTKQVSATPFTTTIMEFLGGQTTDVPKFIQQMALFPTPLSDTDCTTLTT